jgi:hypothetical protein
MEILAIGLIRRLVDFIVMYRSRVMLGEKEAVVGRLRAHSNLILVSIDVILSIEISLGFLERQFWLADLGSVFINNDSSSWCN